MEKIYLDDNIKRLLQDTLIPFALYRLENQRIKTVMVSEGLCNLFGASREEIINLLDRDMYHYTHPDDLVRAQEEGMRFAAGGEQYDIVYRTRSAKDSNYHIIHSVGSHMLDRDGNLLSLIWYVEEGTVEDEEFGIGYSLKKALAGMIHEESMVREIYFDHRTGLPNMTYFLQLAEAGCNVIRQEKQTPVFLFFDLTGLKFYNRKYGMTEGDRLLCAFADILRMFFANENCGRMGHDHFVVYTENHHVEETLEQIFEALSKANEGKTLPVRAGIYVMSDREDEAVDVTIACDCAKLACDENKNLFRSHYTYFDEKLRKKFEMREYVINHFNEAIEKNWIHPYYQQIVRTVTGEVCDAEALARWIDPVRGMISPAEFIEVLEDARLIHLADLHILDCVLADLQKSLDDNLGAIPVSINLSRYDFELCDIVDEIIRRVDRAGVPHELLNMEITESVTGIEEDYVKEQIRRFHEAGFEVWMDDFGSGYSSLHVLQHFDFDVIKFDMAFMKNFNLDDEDQVVLSSLMQMVTRLGIDTVAEGVENRQQIRFLKEIGCDKIQGYYFSKPTSSEDLNHKYKKGDGIPFENPESKDYIDAVSKANLLDYLTRGEYDSDLTRSFEQFNHLPLGIIELQNGHFRILRYNDAYAQFLVRTNFVDEKDIKESISVLDVKRKPEPGFCKAVDDAVDTAGWVLLKDSVEGNVRSNAYVRKLSTNPVNHATALLVVVLTMGE